MELRHLRYFVAVAEEGTLTRAAAKLGIQQPPLGQQIRALEDSLGVDLFDRFPKRIVLNAAGRVFLKEAKRLLNEADGMRRHIQRFAAGEEGSVAVGFTSSASLHRMTPFLIGSFRESYPKAKIAVEEGETYKLLLALQQERLDAAFLRILLPKDAEIMHEVLNYEPILAAIPRRHRLASDPDKPLMPELLHGERMISYPRKIDGPGFFREIITRFRAEGVEPLMAEEVQRIMAALNLVAAGRGVTLVPASMRVMHTQDIMYRHLHPKDSYLLPLSLVHKSDPKLQLVQNFLDIARSASPLCQESSRSL